MKAKHWLTAVFGGLALAFLAMSAQAAPISGPTTSLKAAVDANSIVEETHWRRHHRYYYGGYYPYSYSYRPYAYYYYNYPAYGFYYYGHRRHHHHHYRHYRRW